MTREQANEYNNELKVQLQNCAKEMQMDQQTGTYIIDRFIEFMPEEHVMSMMFGAKTTVSFKPGNVRIDLKKAILAGLNLMVSINAPENIYGYIRLLILSVLFIEQAFVEKLNEIESRIVYWLHDRGAYQRGVEEEQFILNFQEWYQEEEGKALSREDLTDAINHLYQIKVAYLENGCVYLKERIWGQLP